MSRKNSLLSEIQKLDEIIPIADERAIDEFLCEDGKAQIDLNLNDGIELFNPLSFGKQRDLNSAVHELIDAKLHMIPLIYPIRICFHGKLPDSHEQQEIREVIRRHYSDILCDKKEDLRINLLKTVIMTIFGVALLTIYFALELTLSNPVFMEFLSIAGWVAAWEAVDSWFLQRKAIRMEYLSAGQAVLSEVRFSEDKS